MVVLDEGGVRRFQRVFAQKPPGNMLQHVDADALCVLTHGGDAEVRPMRDYGCEQRRIDAFGAGFVAAEGSELAREVTIGVDLAQEVFDANASQAGLDQPPQGGDLWTRIEGIAAV